MFHFDVTQEPLTNLELKTELQRLKEQRQLQIKYSCISDVLHALVFISLYFNHFLSGYAILVAVGLSTVVALGLATVPRPIHIIAVISLSLGIAITTILYLCLVMKQPFLGCLVASLTTGSIVVTGATLGHKIKTVLTSIENMKPIVDDAASWQQVMALCNKYPEFERYRLLAAQYLRPYLTYGELAAMQRWVKEHT